MGVEGGFNYKTRVFLVLWIVNFVLTFAVSLISTPVPYLTREFVSGDDVQTATMVAYGLILSLGSVAITLGYFVGGFAADLVGKKNVIIVAFVIMAAGCGLYAVSLNLYFLYLAAFVLQFGSGFSAPAISALVADYSELRSRGMAYGIYNLSWITSQIPAPLLGGAIAQFVNIRTPFVVAVAICIVGLLFSVLMKGKHVERRQSSEKMNGSVKIPDANQVASYKKAVLIYSSANLLNGMLNGFASPLFSGLLMFKFAASLTEYGLVFSLGFAAVTAIVQIPGGKLTDKFGRKPLALFGFLGAPLMFALAYTQSIWEFGLIIGLLCAVGNISSPAILAWIMDLVPEHKRASVSGITRAVNGVGLAVGPPAGSYVWNLSKPDVVFPYGLATLLFASALPFYLALKETKISMPKPDTP